jgi:two-component system phosphate regulon response regulator PhoB
MTKLTLLVIEDEEAIRDMLRFSLPRDEFNLIDAENTSRAMEVLLHNIPDLIILDWMLPDMNGVDFLKWIRKEERIKNIPVIMLTARAEEDNKLMGLYAGADDYITKPFSPNELAARIRAVLRRGVIKSPEGNLVIDDICMNTDKASVTVSGAILNLTPNEYKLLHFFLKHPNKVYTRDVLMDYIWGRSANLDERSIDVQIKRLRAKLKPFGYHERIKTVRSTGYKFE